MKGFFLCNVTINKKHQQDEKIESEKYIPKIFES